MLDEAIAKLDILLGFGWDKSTHGGADAIAAIHAAVRDVALAVANWPTEAELDSCQIGATAESEINRLLPSGSEGGK